MEAVSTIAAVNGNRVRLFEELYTKAFPAVARFVSSRHGTYDDAKDIFQDALVVFHEKLIQEGVEITVSDEAYILGIAKHLWLRKYKHDRTKVQLSLVESLFSIPDDFYENVQTSRLLNLLERAGRKCLELLQAFYYRKSSMNEIGDAFGFASEHSAAVQKYKCLEKVRDIVKEKSLQYEDFTE